MKKLSLEMLRLSTNEILERSQLSKIFGGSNGDPVMIMCDCTTSSGGSTYATCTEDLVNQGGNKCCSASYESSSQQSNCGPTFGG
ncbi:hypothetical protein [Algoriphagus sp.]|uniref:hypothetical protein n=1 Tax=Algoriphagus sp. TaxID=1872435 RepID=UPI00391CFF10